MVSFRTCSILPALLLAFYVVTGFSTGSAGEKKHLDRLILNGGENLHIKMARISDSALIITHGRAERVPDVMDDDAPLECRKSTVELDIGSRSFSLKTSARQILISGAKIANIAGVDTSCWGDFEIPAVFIDRDCKVTLKGKATQRAVVEVHPLAIATVDAKHLETKEIMIVGNTRTNVLYRPGTKVSFFKRENMPATRTSGSAENWGTAPDVAAPAVTPAPAGTPSATPPSGAPAPPKPTSEQNGAPSSE